MGFLDKAKDSMRKVAEQAQEGLSEAKDKGQEIVLKRKINGLAEELGHLVLRQKAGETGVEPEIDRVVSEVRAIEAEIAALDED